jgi:hypothetical protein
LSSRGSSATEISYDPDLSRKRKKTRVRSTASSVTLPPPPPLKKLKIKQESVAKKAISNIQPVLPTTNTATVQSTVYQYYLSCYQNLLLQHYNQQFQQSMVATTPKNNSEMLEKSQNMANMTLLGNQEVLNNNANNANIQSLLAMQNLMNAGMFPQQNLSAQAITYYQQLQKEAWRLSNGGK